MHFVSDASLQRACRLDLLQMMGCNALADSRVLGPPRAVLSDCAARPMSEYHPYSIK